MKTVFIRAIEAPVDEKAAVLREAAREQHRSRFGVDAASFSVIPKSPFAYWASELLLAAFETHRRFDERYLAIRGAYTTDDFRYYRLAWEVPVAGRAPSGPGAYVPLAKGGAFSPFYADVHLAVGWFDGGHELKAFLSAYRERKGWGTDWSACLNGYGQYFRPGLTWPLRTQGGLSIRVMPKGCVFGHKGPAAFVEDDDSASLLALAAITNSRPFATLVEMQMAFGSYEVGVIQRTPVPDLAVSDAVLVGGLGQRCWSLKRRLDTRTENSHAFLLPALLQFDGDALQARAQAWSGLTISAEAELRSLSAEIDDHAYRLYGISEEDRRRIEQGFGVSESAEGEGEASDDEGDEAEAELAEADAAPMVASLLSWALGVAFGRFDVRLATGARAAPPEPAPFDPLPVCSPGMLTGEDGLPLAVPPAGYPLSFPGDGVLVDDPGHPRDLVRAVRAVFEAVFDDANARWHEAAELLGASDLRPWFARDFFEPHIKRYSKSRRKAPIYWQLATASGSYSVWLYIHRATGDTLFRVLHDFVEPKLDHEKAKLDAQTREAGPHPSAAQRRDLEQQEDFVGELQALRMEVARVAPLWRPDLDDGVILDFAPLWRLVPQSRSWQGECRKAWDKLQAGDYDWAHLAMHLWPERVVPKCAEDRSLAIAHGLEDAFWHEDDAGTWRKRRVEDAAVRGLIAERTSTTVKAALRDLLSAPTPAAGKGRKPSAGRGPAPRAAAPKPAPAAPRATAAPGPAPAVDEATLGAVKAAIARVAEGASKADVLAATGLTEADWTKAIAALLDRGDVTRTGQKRGTRYHTKGG